MERRPAISFGPVERQPEERRFTIEIDGVEVGDATASTGYLGGNGSEYYARVDDQHAAPAWALGYESDLSTVASESKRAIKRELLERWADSRPPTPPAGTEIVQHVAAAPAPESDQPLNGHQAEAVRAAAADSLSPDTRRAYGAQWKQWERWATEQGFDVLPARPEHVAAYLVHRAETSSAATVRASRAGIGAVHRAGGHADPTAHAGVRKVLRGLARRTNGHHQRQAAALTSDALAAVRATASLPRRRGRGIETPDQARARGAVDVAICAVLRDAMLRRSEAAALRWADVEFRSDGSARLSVVRAKGGADDLPQVAYAGPGAAKALRNIRPADVDPAARVFGLGPAQIARRVRDAAKAAGLEGAFSGHSGRVGMARDLVAAGASVAAVQVAGAWKSARMPAHYARAELAGRGAVAAYYAGGGR